MIPSPTDKPPPRASDQEAQRLGGLTIDELDEEISTEVDGIVSEVTDSTDRMDALLQENADSTFSVLSATLTTNYAEEIHRLRRLQLQYDDCLPPHATEIIDDLIHRLQDIDVARQYFKTIYMQEELAVLSRGLFYVGLTSVAAVISGLFVFTATRGASLPSSYLTILLPTIITIGLLPICVLFSFILRIATVSQRMAAVLPFTTPLQER